MAKQKRRYTWAKGSRHTKVNAQPIGEEMAALQAKHGAVNKRMLLKAARKKSSAMHDCFTWDKTEAARKWNEEEARYIINHIDYVLISVNEDTHEDEETNVRALMVDN